MLADAAEGLRGLWRGMRRGVHNGVCCDSRWGRRPGRGEEAGDEVAVDVHTLLACVGEVEDDALEGGLRKVVLQAARIDPVLDIRPSGLARFNARLRLDTMRSTCEMLHGNGAGLS